MCDAVVLMSIKVNHLRKIEFKDFASDLVFLSFLKSHSQKITWKCGALYKIMGLKIPYSGSHGPESPWKVGPA